MHLSPIIAARLLNVYGGVHTLPPPDLNLWPLRRKQMFLAVRPTQIVLKYCWTMPSLDANNIHCSVSIWSPFDRESISILSSLYTWKNKIKLLTVFILWISLNSELENKFSILYFPHIHLIPRDSPQICSLWTTFSKPKDNNNFKTKSMGHERIAFEEWFSDCICS